MLPPDGGLCHPSLQCSRRFVNCGLATVFARLLRETMLPSLHASSTRFDHKGRGSRTYLEAPLYLL